MGDQEDARTASEGGVMPWIVETGFIVVVGRECEITIEPRPSYCDRGNYIAKLFPTGTLARDIDHQDGWPRYYFDLDRAKAECEAWLVKRRQQPPSRRRGTGGQPINPSYTGAHKDLNR